VAGPFVVDVVTLFPEMFVAVTHSGVTRRALETGRWSLQLWNPRDFTRDRHRSVDDRPYGGGPGMVMMPQPLEAAIEAAQERGSRRWAVASRVICLSPQGSLLTHARVLRLAQAGEALVLVCGRYEGIDERLIDAVSMRRFQSGISSSREAKSRRWLCWMPSSGSCRAC
jgi:tRNA (guanine37-N1)-methyltransferase